MIIEGFLISTAMAEHNSPMEFYRGSAAGIALTNALNSMLETEEITTEDALKILDEFDRSFQTLLHDNLVIKKDIQSVDVNVSG